MRETEKRIRLYQARLPKIREKIVAALLVFALSASIMTVATFSWITLSVAPEVSGFTTTIAANSNLEIALAYEVYVEYDENGNIAIDDNGNDKITPIAPDASAVGDGAKEKITDRNLTWGNLINLSDPSYGLENIVLRPARLNRTLKTKPLVSAVYSYDGRVSTTSTNYAYVKYDETYNNFISDPTKGVKAISSVSVQRNYYDSPVIMAMYDELEEKINGYLSSATSQYNALAKSPSMDAVAGLVSTYMQAELLCFDSATRKCEAEHITKFYALMQDLYDKAVKNTGMALMYMFNYYMLDTYGIDEGLYVPFENLDDFCKNAEKALNDMNEYRKSKGKDQITAVKPTNMTDGTAIYDVLKDTDDMFNTLFPFIADRAKLKSCLDTMKSKNYVTQDGVGTADVLWKDIKPTVQFLVDVNTVLIEGETLSYWTTGWSDIFGGGLTKMTTLLGMMGTTDSDIGKNDVVIKQGMLQRMDTLLHDGTKGLTVDKIIVSIPKSALETRVGEDRKNLVESLSDPVLMEANIKTDALKVTNPNFTGKDFDIVKKYRAVVAYDEVLTAIDTYGLSIDFWLRTNADNSYLILEGTPQYEKKAETANTIINGQSMTVEVYVADVTSTKMQRNVVIEQDGENVTITPVAGTDKTIDGEPPITTSNKICQVDGKWYNILGGKEVVTETIDNLDADAGVQYYTKYTISGDPKLSEKREVNGYSGVNRIWNEEDMSGMAEPEYSTTQGSGSCYTFYAEPGEENQILSVLDAFTIAFANAEGKLLATARLATELCYSNEGKHIVPIVLNANEEVDNDTGFDDINGDDIRSITKLNKNEPTFITAIVYLNGDVISNDMVFSSANINGQLNIQFGSTKAPDPIKDEELMTEELRISAAVFSSDAAGNIIPNTKNPTFDFTGADDEKFYTLVTLNVQGSVPSTITAYFMRVISATQGKRMEKITFTKDANDGTKWTAVVPFAAPGNYILRTVIADGVERSLFTESENDGVPTVTVNGFTVNGLKSLSGNEPEHTFRTASNTVEEKFSITVAGHGEGSELRASKVQGTFIYDNIQITVDFKPEISGSTTWVGTAVFSMPGTYVLENIKVDGEYYPLTIPYTRTVYTGLRVSTWVSLSAEELAKFDDNEELGKLATGGYEYIFRDKIHEFNVKMQIYDRANNSMGGLDDVNLYYTGENASMEWNSAEGYYTGSFFIDSANTYDFLSVTVGTGSALETINRSKSAESIIAMPSDPVVYLGIKDAIKEQVMPLSVESDTAKITLNLKYGQSAIVFGKFTKTTTANVAPKTYIIKAQKQIEEGTDTAFAYFTVPSEDGYWVLEEVKITQVAYTDAEGNIGFYRDDEVLSGRFEDDSLIYDTTTDQPTDYWSQATAENYYIIGESEWDAKYENVNGGKGTKVIAEGKLTHNIGDTVKTSYGKDSSGNVTATFMTANNTGAINISYVDFEGESLASSMTIYLERLQNMSKSYGGYTIKDDKVETITLNMSQNGQSFTTSTTLSIAGQYGTSVEITLRDNKGTKELKLPSFEVWSVKPTATVSAVSLTESHPTNISYSVASGCDDGTPTFEAVDPKANSITTNNDNIEVYLYAQSTADNSTRRHGTFTSPSLTMQFSGVGSGSTVSLTLTGTDGLSAVDFSRTGDGTVNKTLGSSSQIESWYENLVTHTLSAYYGYGDKEITQITITKDGITCTVELDKKIIIHNPSSIPYKK